MILIIFLPRKSILYIKETARHAISYVHFYLRDKSIIFSHENEMCNFASVVHSDYDLLGELTVTGTLPSTELGFESYHT